MALSQEILNESELAKSYITNSDFDDDYKKTLLNLVNLTTLSTNGISYEEKIQKMTEAIHMLAITQVSFITKVDEKIEKSIDKANIRQCSNCKAMRYTSKQEEEQKRKEIIAQYKAEKNIKDDQNQENDKLTHKNWVETIKDLLLRPYFWIWLMVLSVSPYGCEILKQLISVLQK